MDDGLRHHYEADRDAAQRERAAKVMIHQTGREGMVSFWPANLVTPLTVDRLAIKAAF